jgi:cytochrome c biogenesis protein CcmG, thiol:disulfide interchange protein DsbE
MNTSYNQNHKTETRRSSNRSPFFPLSANGVGEAVAPFNLNPFTPILSPFRRGEGAGHGDRWPSARIRLLAIIVAQLLGVFLATAAPLKEGDAFPDLNQFGLEGAVPDIRGKVVLVDFFASWCHPCQESFPVMEELHKQFAGKGLVIIAINLDKNKSDMDDFLKSYPASFVILRDAGNKLVSRVKIPTMPSSFLLDRDGKIRAFHRGFKGAESKKKYTEEIEALLK